VSRIRSVIVSLLAKRAPSSSICPSEVARAMHPGDEVAWRALMPEVREVAQAMAAQGVVRITRKGQPVPQADLHTGAIRLSRGPGFDNTA
jgi:diadenosine tetraphosphate (Ap4A) HIT family hydrolase